MKVFVTGHRGFIGSHLVDFLKREGHAVVGCDVRLFDGCEWDPMAPVDVDLIKDVRKVEHADLAGCDALMHLTALPDDATGELDPGLTLEVNRDASVRLAGIAKEAGVPRFLFAADCARRGPKEKAELDETDPVASPTAYARAKVEAEAEIAKLADEAFSPVFLRVAEAYGYSPAPRFDLFVNGLLASALVRGEIRLGTDGSPWRPLIHCRDVAGAFVAIARAPRDVVHGKAINIGDNGGNHQVKDVADLVLKLVPDAKVVHDDDARRDPGDHRVKFDLLHSLLPDFQLQYDLGAGMEELHRKMLEHGFSREDFEGDRFDRLRALARRLDRLS